MRRKYTLELPSVLYDELKNQAKEQGRSIKEVLRQCIQFGLTAMKISRDPNADIIFRERVLLDTKNGQQEFEYQDTVVKFIL